MPTSCEHLKDLSVSDFPPPRTPDACEECVAEGTKWVALRECRACGHVGCCDSSPRKHSTRHLRNPAPGHALGHAGRELGLVLPPPSDGKPRLREESPSNGVEYGSPSLSVVFTIAPLARG
jgi:hypothetical protein